MTHTYATLQVSRVTYDEIAEKFRAAGYDHAFDRDFTPAVIDMHGVGLLPDSGPQLCFVCGRPPHTVDDPQCMPATKPIAEQLSWALGEIQRLRALRFASDAQVDETSNLQGKSVDESTVLHEVGFPIDRSRV